MMFIGSMDRDESLDLAFGVKKFEQDALLSANIYRSSTGFLDNIPDMYLKGRKGYRYE